MSAAITPETAARPLTAAAFAAAMAALGPFPAPIKLAVAVSGGADSLALALLARDWLRRRRGELVALTVDHGLRPEAAAEARQVGRWLAAAGIAHRVLRWSPPDMGGRRANLQARARDARYDLLADWCLAHGIGDLLLAHHRDDQAETFLLRLARGSGVDGLACMAPVATREFPRGALRLLRPLLDVPKTALVSALRRRGQPWIEDPSNADPAHARVRWRRRLPELAADGVTAERLAATAAHLARARDALGAAVAALLADAARAEPAGFVVLDAQRLTRSPREIGLRALARVLAAVGGGAYAPRHQRLCRLYDELAAGLDGGRTLAGCRLRPMADGVLVLREAAAMAPPVALTATAPVIWDGRFRVSLRRPVRAARAVGALGDAGLRELRRRRPDLLQGCAWPRLALPTLPAIYDRRGLLAVPHLALRRPWRGREATEKVEDYRVEGLARL